MSELRNLRVLVLGGTGQVGREIVKELMRNEEIQKIKLISRRHLVMPEEWKKDKSFGDISKLTEKIVDFDKLSEDYGEEFAGFDVGICALGTTRDKSGLDGVRKVDHDYVLEAAKLAKTHGCKQFHLVSASWADENSYLYELQVKREIEKDVEDLNFDRLCIYRPGLLLCDREGSKIIEKISVLSMRFLDRWRYYSVETQVLAKAIVNNCFRGKGTNFMQSRVQVFENKECNWLGKN